MSIAPVTPWISPPFQTSNGRREKKDQPTAISRALSGNAGTLHGLLADGHGLRKLSLNYAPTVRCSFHPRSCLSFQFFRRSTSRALAQSKLFPLHRHRRGTLPRPSEPRSQAKQASQPFRAHKQAPTRRRTLNCHLLAVEGVFFSIGFLRFSLPENLYQSGIGRKILLSPPTSHQFRSLDDFILHSSLQWLTQKLPTATVPEMKPSTPPAARSGSAWEPSSSSWRPRYSQHSSPSSQTECRS